MNKNIKIILSIAAFSVTFSVALISFTTLQNFSKLSLFNDQQNIEHKNNIHKFLKNDAKLLREMSAEIEQNELKEVKNWKIIQKYYKIRASQNVSNLPEDFQYAWERKILCNIEWLNYADHLININKVGSIQTLAEKEITEEKMAEDKFLDNKFQNVAESYGIKFDEYGNFVE